MTIHRRIPTSTRVLISLITDRCLDVNLAGKHWAYQYTYVGSIPSREYLGFRIVTMPVEGTHGSPASKSFDADIDALWADTPYGDATPGEAEAEAKAKVEGQLTEMLEHLDALLIEAYQRHEVPA